MKELRKMWSPVKSVVVSAMIAAACLGWTPDALAGLSYSTYLGTTVEDKANAIAVDSAGNVYLTGQTAQVGDVFPGTAAHFQTSNNGGSFDAYVIKISAAGAIVWATYLGGAGDDIGRSIAIDGTNAGGLGPKVYITGSTTFTAGALFPTNVAFQAVNGGGSDAFVTAIQNDGNSLVYSTFLGGAGIDLGTAIVVDSAGNAYITGGMTSDNTTRAASAGAYQVNNGGPGGAVENAFVAKFDAAGTNQYLTYLGGSVTGGTRGNAIAIDGTGNAYVTGYCRDTFPTFPSGVLPLARAFKLTIGGAQDAFVSKISASGANLLYSTYLGGSGISQGMGIKLDTVGNVYVTGDTDSTNFPDATTDGNTVGFAKVGQTTIIGNFDAFMFKLAMNATGHADGVYCTFLGGSGLDHVNALALDSFGDAYVTGRTESGDFLTAANGQGQGSIQTPIDIVQNGTAKVFVTVFGPAGNTRILNTYIGGVTDQEGQGIGLDSGHNIYVTGWTNSSDFPTAGTAPMPLFSAKAGSADAFVLKLSPTSPPPASAPTITSLTPTLGTVLGGTTVVITGTDFASVTSVQFGATNAFSYTVASSTVITAVTPAHVAGAVDVVVTTTAGASANTAADNFVFIAPTPGPTLTAVSPTLGATTGGTSVALTGTGLTGVTLVTFGGTNAFSFIVNSDTLITALSPAHAAGVVDIVVSNAFGVSPVVLEDRFTFVSPPAITALIPTLGTTAGGTTVSITGTGLTGVTLVTFGGANAASFVVSSSTLITAVSPAHAAGVVDIIVTNEFGASAVVSADQFTYFTPVSAPAITSVNPTLGANTGGTTVTITGTDFTNVTSVQFGAVNAFSYVVASSTVITAVSPAHVDGVFDIVVTTVVGPSANTVADNFVFTLIAPAAGPTLTALSPTLGATTGGTPVKLTGTGLTGVTLVTFGGTNAFSFIVNSDTLISAVSPAHVAGVVDVIVSNALGVSPTVLADRFTFVSPPAVAALTPTLGTTTGGTTVFLTGTGFTGVTLVSFGGTNAASFVVNSNTLMTVVSPTHAAGVVNVVVSNTFGASSTGSGNRFTYFTPASPPSITSLTPTLGSVLGGTTVVVTGTGFTSVISVQFSGTNAFSFVVASSTVLTAVSPAHAVGAVDVVVTTPSGASANTVSDNYVYIAPAPGPTLTALSITFGSTTGGTSVALTGTGFTGVATVSFGGVNAFSFIVNSDTLITALSPAHVAGVVDIIVSNSLGTSPVVLADRFTFVTPAPVISGISPILGTIYGGTTVSIMGSGLTGVTLIVFGSTPAASFVINSDSLMTAVSPAHAAGVVDIRATNPVNTTPIVAADQFTYFTPLPVVTGLNTILGTTTGGTTVVISGTGFASVVGSAGVRFGGVNAASYVVNSDTRITAVSPTHAVGMVDVIVRAPVGPSAVTSADQFTYFFVPVVSGTVTPFDPYVFPSPANKGTATVAYFMASSGSVKARFYNAVGVLVGTLSETGKTQTANASVFEVGDWAPGVYYCLVTVAYDDGTSKKYSRVKFAVTR